MCVHEFKIGYTKQSCEECRKDKSHEKKARNRNCGYIDPALWKGLPRFNKDIKVEFTECPNSVYQRNFSIIHCILMLAQEHNPTIDLTYLENRAIIDFKTALNLCDSIIREEESKKQPKPGHTKL
jgi:hypothetical protein